MMFKDDASISTRDICTLIWFGHIRCASMKALGLENLTKTYLNTPLSPYYY